MNYIGSKLSLLPFIYESIHKIIEGKEKIFCDIFAGTSVVSSFFKKKGFSIIANDLQYYSFVLNKHYIETHNYPDFKKLENEIKILKTTDTVNKPTIVCEYLSKTEPLKGFIYKNYSLGGTKGSENERFYFSDENALMCDAIRMKIEDWFKHNQITENEYYFLLTTLLESIDKYANTASVYGAFLKKIKNSASKKLILKPAEIIINDNEHSVYNMDANKLIENIECDILYLDPPYNSRQYASNYHILETIARYDNPKIFGKTGLRDYYKQKSKYCSKNTVKNAFMNLIKKSNAKYIFLSYNNEGILSFQEIKEIMSSKGNYGVFHTEYNRFKADSNRICKSKKTTEYLHYCICA